MRALVSSSNCFNTFNLLATQGKVEKNNNICIAKFIY